MKKCISIALLLAMLLTVTGCGGKQTVPTDGLGNPIGEAAAPDEIVILFTGEVWGAYQRQSAGPMGYAALAAYEKKLENDGETVVLIDGGDALPAEVSKGADFVRLMNAVGYDIAVPGEREFALGVEALRQAEYAYLSCNVLDKTTSEMVFPPYIMAEYGDVKVAYVGVTSPRAAPAALESYSFSEGDNDYALYERVQRAVNLARSDGADYVIGVSYLGTEPNNTPWTSVEVIANVSGLDVLLDAASQSVIEGANIVDKGGSEVLLCAVGSQLTNIGQLRLNFADGTKNFTLVTGLTAEDKDILTRIEELMG